MALYLICRGKSSHLNQKLTNMTLLARQLAMVIPYLHLQSTGIMVGSHTHAESQQGQGSELCSSYLHGKYFSC